MKIARCDGCGAEDDVRFGDEAILPHGVVLRFRESNGGPGTECDAELCEECRGKLLATFPRVRELVEGDL